MSRYSKRFASVRKKEKSGIKKVAINQKNRKEKEIIKTGPAQKEKFEDSVALHAVTRDIFTWFR